MINILCVYTYRARTVLDGNTTLHSPRAAAAAAATSPVYPSKCP